MRDTSTNRTNVETTNSRLFIVPSDRVEHGSIRLLRILKDSRRRRWNSALITPALPSAAQLPRGRRVQCLLGRPQWLSNLRQSAPPVRDRASGLQSSNTSVRFLRAEIPGVERGLGNP